MANNVQNTKQKPKEIPQPKPITKPTIITDGLKNKPKGQPLKETINKNK